MLTENGEDIIFEFTDHIGDTLRVENYLSSMHGQVVIIHADDNGSPWLTRAASKRLRKVLKQWERAHADA